MDEYGGRQYVGIDLHRRRSVIVRMTPDGQRLGSAVRIDNDPFELARQVGSWGESPQVVLEATYGWYWAADVLADAGAVVHLAHPLGIKGFAYRRVKNDERDAADLADLLRMGRLPEAWIAPPEIRGLREAVRHRCKLVALRSGLKAQVHAVLAKQGVRISVSDLFGVGGQKLLDELSLDAPFHARVVSLRRLIDAFTFEIDVLAKRTEAQLKTHPGYQSIQTIRGVGPVLAAVFVAEIGDVTRFARPEQLCSWAGLTPRHRESDTKVHRGRITKQGNHLVRWAAVEAVQTLRSGPIGRAWANTAARTSARPPQPANSSRWSSTGYATGTSVAWPDQRDHQPGAARTRGRWGYDPHQRWRGRVNLIDPAWLQPHHSMPPQRARRRDDRQPDHRLRHIVHSGHWRKRPHNRTAAFPAPR
ncbi:Transposase [Micromonospora viridifaciens]|uniref:Transposase n=1 Tax=Micromonospora viridifaciens TaxID=1881 RepID=A0A1C4V6T9_MICVI|nr:IS110 family transposase [Micromonospora viridifaciens]SCE79684.1 Transposase [Micromonospora viridifaciens]